MSLLIVTNNEKTKAEYDGCFAVEYVDGSPLDVLDLAVGLLQRNHRLVSTPLPPNIPLMRAPFRSLILERSERQYDERGILAVEKAREAMQRQRGIAADDERSGSKAADFAAIDLDLLRRTLRDCGD